jgi:hypothetical protein|tara:strand:- start:184 stop:588 length:405 start_codon:yes stop_codon:yes gene_type:complete
MPPALYNLSTGGFYSNKEEMVKSRKSKDNMKQKLKYWRNKYGYDVTKKDYEEFDKHSSNIKHIYDIHDWFVNYTVGDPIDEDIHGIFFARQSYILRALLSQEYIKTLKKIEPVEELSSEEENTLIKNNKYVIEF